MEFTECVPSYLSRGMEPLKCDIIGGREWKKLLEMGMWIRGNRGIEGE